MKKRSDKTGGYTGSKGKLFSLLSTWVRGHAYVTLLPGQKPSSVGARLDRWLPGRQNFSTWASASLLTFFSCFLACSFQPDQGTYLRWCCTVRTALAGFCSLGCALGYAAGRVLAVSQRNRDLWTEPWGSPVILILKTTHTRINFKNKQTNRKVISLVLLESCFPKVTEHMKEPATHEKNILRRNRNLL